jgi:phosphate-selective porin OprO/OprP
MVSGFIGPERAASSSLTCEGILMSRCIACALFAFLLTAPVGAQELNYSTALQYASEDGQFKLKLGGRMHNNWTWYSADDEFATASGNVAAGDAEPSDGTIFRRARLYLAGTIYGNIDFKAQYDFAGGDADFKDLYMEVRDVPAVGSVRVGQFYEPFGLEAQTSSNYITFIERSSGTGPIAPERSTGFMTHGVNGEENMTWWIGAFRDSASDGDAVGDNKMTFTGRATWLPWATDDGDLVHLGVAASLRSPEGDTVNYQADPEVRPSVDVLETGAQAVDEVTYFGLEAATVQGPLSLQAEYMTAMNEGSEGAEDFDISHYYIFASYFLTGEKRAYSNKKAIFSRVKPNTNYGSADGNGAWEVGLRYSGTDFDDGAINGGTMTQTTLGLNWYLNPNVRIMTNVVLMDVEDIAGDVGVDGSAEAFTMRFQIDF